MTKKYLNLFVLAGLSLLSLVGCQKDGQGVTLKAKISPVANGADKLFIDGFSTYWTSGDAVFVNDQSGCAVSINNDGSAIIQGVTSSSSYAAVYPSSIVNSGQSVSAGSPVNITLPETQEYSQVDGNQIVSVPMAAYTTGTTLDFANLCSVVKVDVTNSTGAAFSLNSITITAEGARLAGAGVLTIASNGNSNIAMSEGAKSSVSLDFGNTPDVLSANANKSYYLVLPAFTERNIDIVFHTTSNGEQVAYRCQKTNKLSANTIANLTLNVAAQEPSMLGVFTAGEHGPRVRFSPGNLQYIGSAATPYWRFAPNQWDVIGNRQNSTTADDPSKDRDLFGWGTSGYAGEYANVYHSPFYTSSNGNSSQGYGYGPHRSNNYQCSLVGDYALADWGMNNQIWFGSTVYPAGTWRTLTNAEWSWVMSQRQNLSRVGINSQARYVRVKVNEVNGLLIFPDVFVWPEAAGDAPTNVNESTSWNAVNAYDVSAFEALQAAGCVFLPATGRRVGTSVSGVNQEGYYWSSVYSNNDKAYATGLPGSGTYSRNLGLPVRLVQNVVSQ